MPSEETTNAIALALTIIFIIGVLLYGFFIIQQLLLSGFIAFLGVLVYIAWRAFR